MKVIQFELRGRKLIGLEMKEGVFNYSRAMQAYIMLNRGEVVRQPDDVLDLLHQGLFTKQHLQELVDFSKEHDIYNDNIIDKIGRILCPLPRPGKVIGVGWNYARHAAEGGFEVPEEPVFFAKAPSCVIGPEEEIRVPRDLGRVDPEAELAVVIGQKASRVSKDEAVHFIAGYTCFNDVTAREVQRADQAAQRPWFRSKSVDTFGPLGPRIVTPDEFEWPPKLDLELTVNGETRQKENTEKLVFPVPDLIEAITRHITLEPGDVICTGTPEGIAPLADGDEVIVKIEGLGELKNPVKFVD